MMKSVRLQLLVTLVATVVVAGVFAIRGLPPGMDILEAAGRDDVGAVRRNIRWGVDVNVNNDYGMTPLHFGYDEDTAALHIAKGADVNAKDNKGRTPLTLATEKGHTDIADFLRRHGAKE